MLVQLSATPRWQASSKRAAGAQHWPWSLARLLPTKGMSAFAAHLQRQLAAASLLPLLPLALQAPCAHCEKARCLAANALLVTSPTSV